MKLTPEMLELFFWIYLFEAQSVPEKERKTAARNYSNLIEAAVKMFNDFLKNGCPEGFISFEENNIYLKKEAGQVIFRLEFKNKNKARTYIKALERYRDFDKHNLEDYVNIVSLNLNDFDKPTRVQFLLKSPALKWGLVEGRPEAVEIKIRDG